jgi:hypothetical protein
VVAVLEEVAIQPLLEAELGLRALHLEEADREDVLSQSSMRAIPVSSEPVRDRQVLEGVQLEVDGLQRAEDESPTPT